MPVRFEPVNPWWTRDEDPVVAEWNARDLKWTPSIVHAIARTHEHRQPGLHFLTGPRQVGKTTTLHLVAHDLLNKKVDPFSICFFQCDEIYDYHELGDVIDEYLATRKARGITSSIMLLDEVTFVKEWWRAVKARIDARQITNDTIVVTGSASLDLLAQKERFPGRRGTGTDVVLLPLDFHQYASLHLDGLVKAPLVESMDLKATCDPNRVFSDRLDGLFRDYLVTGGFPAPIHDVHRSGTITRATRDALIACIKGDIQAAGKSMAFAREIIQYLLQARNSAISYHGISKHTSIQSPNTVISYMELLENVFVTKTLHLLNQQGHVEYRKNKKVHFTDPFYVRVFSDYTNVDVLDEHLVESVVATHLARAFPTYYWKNGSEIDAISLVGNAPVGFEVKYGVKPGRRALHLAKQHVLTRATTPPFLASIDWRPQTIRDQPDP